MKAFRAVALMLVAMLSTAAAMPIRTLADMRRAGHCLAGDERINAANFPVRPERFAAKGARVFSFDRHVSTPEILRAMRRAGYEPATIEQLLAWSANTPMVPNRLLFPVVALSTVWTDGDGLRAVTHVGEYQEGRRSMSLAWLRPELIWPGEYRFLGVRKVNKRSPKSS